MRARAASDALRRALRVVRAPIVVLVVYLALRLAFDDLSRDGLFSPAGSVNTGIAALGALVLVLRIVVLFALPAIVVYRAVDAVTGLFRRAQ